MFPYASAGLILGMAVLAVAAAPPPASLEGYRLVEAAEATGVTVTCHLHGSRPLPGQEEKWERDVADDRAVLAFRAAGVAEETGISIGPVYLEKDGERIEVLDTQATWRPEEGMEWTSAFGGSGDTLYKAVFNYTDYNGLLYEQGQVIHWLRDCRLEETDPLPVYRAVTPD